VNGWTDRQPALTSVDWQSGAQGCTKESQKRSKGRNMGGKEEGGRQGKRSYVRKKRKDKGKGIKKGRLIERRKVAKKKDREEEEIYSLENRKRENEDGKTE
jgi:hypothetical protein